LEAETALDRFFNVSGERVEDPEGRNSENILFPQKAFHILAHQVICLCLQKMGKSCYL